MHKPHIILLTAATGGGTLKHVFDLYAGLKNLGYDVTAVATTDDSYRAELTNAQRKLLREFHIVAMKRSPNPKDIAVLRKLRKILRAIPGPKILHCHSTKAGIYGRFLRNEVDHVLYTAHALRSIDPKLPQWKRIAIRAAERWILSGYERLIAVSPAEEHHLQQLQPQAGNIVYIANGVSKDEIHKDESGEFVRNEEQKTVGFVGRLCHQKNPLLYVDVMHTLLSKGLVVRGLIVGDVEMRTAMLERARSYGIEEKLQWLGSRPATPILPYMDVILHTSYYESMPYALLEAVAATVPVVCVQNDGTQAIFAQALPGRLFGLDDAARIAQETEEILFRQETRQIYLDAYESLAEQFSVEGMVHKIVEQYQSVCS